MKIYDIVWDTDGIDAEDLGLPSETEIPPDVEEDDIADYLSDIYEFLVISYSKKEV